MRCGDDDNDGVYRLHARLSAVVKFSRSDIYSVVREKMKELGV